MEHKRDYMPYIGMDEAARKDQAVWQAELAAACPAVFGENVFISRQAHLYDAGRLEIGENTAIAADVVCRSFSLKMGRNGTINFGCYLQGPITIGDDVRIAPKVNIIADNHRFEDVNTPIRLQGCVAKGITIGDDVWIGCNATILDGVTIGAHTVIAAGATVTRDVPAYSVVGGCPARVLRSRLPAVSEDLKARVHAFSLMVEERVQELLRAFLFEVDGAPTYLNKPGDKPGVRPWCDAVEVAAMFGQIPASHTREEWIERIAGLQSDSVDYNCLTVGYGLEVLGSHIPRPFGDADRLAADMAAYLEGMPWGTDPWNAGNQVDSFGTALYHNKRYHNCSHHEYALFGWLALHADPDTGMWGKPRGEDLTLMVNGFYRLTRGTYAQFGVDLPYPEAAVDTLLLHAARNASLAENAADACHTLDVIHPLWLCGKQTDHRRAEGVAWALRQIDRILASFRETGFSFELNTARTPTLQGLEMWLSILYLLCDYVGIADALTYAPRGVHRTAVAFPLKKG